MKNILHMLKYFGITLIALLLASCGGGGGGSSQGTLSVSLTDAPACGFDAVNVTVSKVRVHQSANASDTDAGWVDITLNPARKINLLDLNNGALLSLGQVPLTTGHYTQLRLVLVANTGNSVANSVVRSGTTTEIAIDTPSGVQSGIKLINEFDVAANQRVDLVLDFDACKSIVQRGNGSFALKPVIRVVPTVLNGIDGFVDTALLGSHVSVTAQQNGVVIGATAPNATTSEFFVGRLVPGNYDVVITADGRASAVIAGVPVASTTSVVMVSTNAAPITLLPATTSNTVSGMVTLIPAADVVAFVDAKQVVGSGPTVTIKTAAANLLNGAYSLTLPKDAPLLGNYGAGTLPIALAAQGGSAGKYAIAASAAGYTSQSTNVDITGGNVTQNFTLIP